MGLDTDNLFGTGDTAQDEFFMSEAEKALRNRLTIKQTNETLVNSAVLQNDNELFYPVEANSYYTFDLTFQFQTNDVEDFKFSFAVPVGAIGNYTNVWFNAVVGAAGDTTRAVNIPNDINYVSQISSAGDQVGVWWTLKGTLKTGNTAGNLNFQWAQRVAGAPAVVTTVYAGSYMILNKQ